MKSLLFRTGFIFLQLTFFILSPLGICLGVFFPQGLKQLSAYNRDMIPWAWGLNGFMSILGSTLSIYLSALTGFTSLFLIALILYGSIIFLPNRGFFS